MGLRKAESQVKILLAETIMAMCRNTLNNHAEVNVEGLLGITLDNDEIFLVSINQTINNPDVPSKAKTVPESTETNDVDGEAHQRKRAKSKTNDSSSDSDEESTKEGKAKRRRKRKRRSKSSNDDSSSGSSESDEESSPVKSVQKVVKQDNDINSQDNNFDLDQNSYSVMPEQDEDQDNSLSNSENVRVKQERAEDDDEEDIVIIKEEMSDLHSDTQFMNMQQQFTNSTFPPDFNSTFPGTPQQSMSSDMSQPQPGPSSSNADASFKDLSPAFKDLAQRKRELEETKTNWEADINSLIEPVRAVKPIAIQPVPQVADTGVTGMAEMPGIVEMPGMTPGITPGMAPGMAGMPGIVGMPGMGGMPGVTEEATSWACTLCKRVFSRKSHAKRHVFTHTGAKEFKCEICLKSFSRNSHIKRHMQMVHKFSL